MKINVVIALDWHLNSTRLRPLALTFPKTLIRVGGYPVIFHHLKALEYLQNSDERYQICNVFLHGSDHKDDIQPFIDEMVNECSFKIKFLQVDGSLRKQHKEEGLAVASLI
jgi:dTDP-glucose pyrophosphorylase